MSINYLPINFNTLKLYFYQMSDSEDFEGQDFYEEIQYQEEGNLLSVRKYLSNPKQLLEKILFTSFRVNPFFPTDFMPIPEIMKADTAQKDPNNMSLIEQSSFRHQKLKNDIFGFLTNNFLAPTKPSIKKILPTMKEFYQTKVPIYEKYQTNPKSKCMATYLLDSKTILKQQIKKNQASIFVQNKMTPLLATHRTKIQFNSNFQCGNLFQVYQVEYNEFDLVLQNDINSKGNCQWFFFLVRNVPKGLILKFNIVNLTKKHSLFDYGMKPYVFSMIRYEKRKVGWVREGLKVLYEENDRFKKEDSEKPYYKLSFQYRFNYQGDIVYFSHSLPYRVGDLANFISGHIKQPCNGKLIKFKDLNITLGNQQLDIIQISEHQYKQSKKVVWIIARQHPGEVTSSFMIEGIINYLLSKNNAKSRELLRKYIFKIVPMVNIDGVIHGNSRSELNGADPNRRWANPHRIRNPIIWSLKKFIEKDKGRIEMFLDLHSHSRKLGTFFYGNSFKDNKFATRKFPWMVSKNDERFDYSSCRFSECNFTSARHVLFEILQIPLIYTVESSFYGYQKNDHRIIEYLPKDYREMGVTLIETFWQYALENQNINLFSPAGCKKQEEEMLNDEDDKQSLGSDSDPGEDEFEEKQLKLLIPNFFGQRKIKKKKIVKKKENKEKTKKTIKEDTPSLAPKVKRNDKESHYKIYFSGRSTHLEKKLITKDKMTIQTKQMGIQVQICENTILKGTTNVSAATLAEKRASLFICGQKMQQQVSPFGNSVGIQADMIKIFSQIKQQGRRTSAPRKSFKVTSRISSVLQAKENNFLNRGDLHTIPMRSTSRR